jgi:hypothetical protein
VFTYDEAKKYLIEQLTRDIESHSRGNFQRVGKNFEVFDLNLPRNSGPEFKKLFIALNFWDSWQDSRNHEWRYYKGISQSDWPRLAALIIKDLDEENEITSPIILDHFDLRPKRTGLKRSTYLWIAVIGFLFGLYCLYAAAYNVWLTAYYTDKARQKFHAIWVYSFLALSVLSFICSGILFHKFRKKKPGQNQK